MSAGRSNIYGRLLAGRVTPERYVAVVKRAVGMQLRTRRADREMANRLTEIVGSPPGLTSRGFSFQREDEGA